MDKSRTLVWVVPENAGGIHDYSMGLWPEIFRECMRVGWKPIDPIFGGPGDLPSFLDRLETVNPQLIHVQHEFGLFGGKVPPLYRFPSWLSALRARLPLAKVIATAHTVLPSDYGYPSEGRGLTRPLRWIANTFLQRRLSRLWCEKTWGPLDGLIVHSASQVEIGRLAGCPRVVEIPLSMPRFETAQRNPVPGRILVFGYFSPEKAQDVAIRALKHLPPPAHLVLAGDARRPADRPYLEFCRNLVKELGLVGRVDFTGFVPNESVPELFARAQVVLAPFRETSGSGTLMNAMAAGSTIAASDLPLNREINLRVPGAIAIFKSEDESDCAACLGRLLTDAHLAQRLGVTAKQYADLFSPAKVAEAHLEFYQGLFRGGEK